MSEETELIELEEEEHTAQLTAPTLKRIFQLLKPHWHWVLGFLVTIALVSSMDAYFTYLNKQIVDQGINMKNFDRIIEIAWIYGAFLLAQAAFIFIFIYLAGVLASACNMTCGKCSSIICKSYRSPTMPKTR